MNQNQLALVISLRQMFAVTEVTEDVIGRVLIAAYKSQQLDERNTDILGRQFGVDWRSWETKGNGE